MSDRERGRLVALEGGEGSGKSTVAPLLARELNAELTHEPGATLIGRRIRSLLVDPELGRTDARAELLLMAADRAEHVARVIEPTLEAGRWVVTDRFSGSSLAYQGYGRGLNLEEVRLLSSWASRGLWPDLNILIDVPDELAAQRRSDQPDRFESESASFHRRVRSGYQDLAHADTEKWVVIDGVGTPEEVALRALDAVLARLGRPRA